MLRMTRRRNRIDWWYWINCFYWLIIILFLCLLVFAFDGCEPCQRGVFACGSGAHGIWEAEFSGWWVEWLDLVVGGFPDFWIRRIWACSRAGWEWGGQYLGLKRSDSVAGKAHMVRVMAHRFYSLRTCLSIIIKWWRTCFINSIYYFKKSILIVWFTYAASYFRRFLGLHIIPAEYHGDFWERFKAFLMEAKIMSDWLRSTQTAILLVLKGRYFYVGWNEWLQ